MDCKQFKQYMEQNLIEKDEKLDFQCKQHLSECGSCKELYESYLNIEDGFEHIKKTALPNNFHATLMQKIESEENATESEEKHYTSIFLRNRKLGSIAAVVLVFLVSLAVYDYAIKDSIDNAVYKKTDGDEAINIESDEKFNEKTEAKTEEKFGMKSEDDNLSNRDKKSDYKVKEKVKGEAKEQSKEQSEETMLDSGNSIASIIGFSKDLDENMYFLPLDLKNIYLKFYDDENLSGVFDKFLFNSKEQNISLKDKLAILCFVYRGEKVYDEKLKKDISFKNEIVYKLNGKDEISIHFVDIQSYDGKNAYVLIDDELRKVDGEFYSNMIEIFYEMKFDKF